EGVDHDQLLHQPLVDRRTVRLEDEDVAAADRLGVPDVDLPVGEVVDIGGEELRPQILRDLFGEFGVRPTADQDELLITRRLYLIHSSVPLRTRFRLPALQAYRDDLSGPSAPGCAAEPRRWPALLQEHPCAPSCSHPSRR